MPGLTQQERVLLDLLGEGLTNRQIAARMFLAEKTVKNYVSRLLAKLGMERRTQAAVLAEHAAASVAATTSPEHVVDNAGIAVAARQIWIINQPPGSVAECGASLDYMMAVLPLHEVLGKVLSGSGECAKVDWTFLGLYMPTWVLIALVIVGTWGLAVNWMGRRG